MSDVTEHVTSSIQTREYAVKVELDPTSEQAVFLHRMCDDRRRGWNELIVRRKAEYQRARDFAELQANRGVSGPLPPTSTRYVGDLPAPQGAQWATAINRPIDDALAQAWKGVGRGGGLPQHKRLDDPRQSFKFQVQKDLQWAGGLRVPLHTKSPIRYKEDPTPRVNGRVKWATVSLDADRWYASLSVEGPMPAVPARPELIVGVDLNTGVIACSDGRRFEIPAALAEIDRKVRQAQHDLSRYRSRRRRAGSPKRSNRYKAAQLELGKLYRTMRFARANWLHHVSTDLTRTCTVLVLEDLNVKNMTKSAAGTVDEPGDNVSAKSGLNRVILNAAFAEFRRQCEYKGAWYGCEIVIVDPAYTSRTCSICQAINKEPLANYRTYVCEGCGHTVDRDDNAAVNIRFRGVTLRASTGSAEDVERVQGLPSAEKRQRRTVSRAKGSKTGDPSRGEQHACR